MNIIELAKEAGFTTATAAYPYEVVPIASPEQLQRFANLIIEECAKVAYEEAKRIGYNVLADNSAAAIGEMKK